MNKKKKLIIAGGIVAVAAIGAVVLLGGKSGGSGGPGGPGGMAQDSSITVVRAETPTTGDLSVKSSLTGTVESEDVVYVYAKASGDVTAVYVQAGDVVEAGQVLCEIDTEQVESAKNSMDSAQVSLSEAQNNLSRMQILYSGGDISDQEYEQYVNAAKSAQLQYESAKLTYDRQVEYSTVTATISGRIESCDVEVYDQVSQSQQLCVIAGNGENRITFYVSQRILENLHTGDAVEVVKNGTTYEGEITEISSIVDSESGMFKIKATMESSDAIPIGSTVKLQVVTGRTENAMLVPVNAVYYSGGDAYVYLYEDGKASMVPVEVGLYDEDYAEIISGISTDDLVIGTWSSNLYEGADVRLYEETTDSGEEAASGSSEEAAADSGEEAAAGSSEETAADASGEAAAGQSDDAAADDETPAAGQKAE